LDFLSEFAGVLYVHENLASQVLAEKRVLNGLANIVYELVVKASQQMSETAKM
jgi:hypothetical protein